VVDEEENDLSEQISVSPMRSRNMAAIKGRDTAPELAVRRIMLRLGYRFRLYRCDLPGRPEIVLPKYRTAIFAHGCFWHRHLGGKYTTSPKTGSEFWEEKFQQNIARDSRDHSQVIAMGWNAMAIWKCDLKHLEHLAKRLSLIHEDYSILH